MPLQNRTDAGQRLADALAAYKSPNPDRRPAVLALPRGGVPVADPIATALDAPLDLILVRKIGVPSQPELAMGAVVDGATPLTVRNDDVIRACGISEAEFAQERDAQFAEIERRRAAYLGGRPQPDITGRVAIVVDDGVATGATARAALEATRRRRPSRLVLAVPVAPSDVLATLGAFADEIVCLEQHDLFGAIGLYYTDFRQVLDGEVIDLLARHPPAAT